MNAVTDGPSRSTSSATGDAAARAAEPHDGVLVVDRERLLVEEGEREEAVDLAELRREAGHVQHADLDVLTPKLVELQRRQPRERQLDLLPGHALPGERPRSNRDARPLRERRRDDRQADP